MKRAVGCVIALLAVIAAFTVARPHNAMGSSLRDFEAYFAAGATWLRGDDPYTTVIWKSEQKLPGVVAARYEILPFVGPPATLPFWAALAHLPYDAAAIAWRALLLASIAALLWCVASLAKMQRSLLAFLALAIAAAGFGAITNAFALGQVALPAAAAISAAFTANGFAGKALGAALASIQPNVGLALAGGFRNKRNIVATLCGVAAVAAICVAITGLPGIATYIQTLQAHASAERFSAIQLTPAAIAYGLGASEFTSIAIGIGVAVAGIAVWSFSMARIGDPLALFVITCALVPFVSPFFHQQDLVLLFVPAVILVVRALPAAFPIALGGALLVATNWLGLLQSPDATVQTALLVAAFAIALLALRNEFGRRAIDIVIGVLLLIVAGGFVAHSHALPVWPDAMTPLPALVRNANIATVWHAEQAATGLFARDTIWALFRCASLAGCALLVYAAALNSKWPARSRTSSQGPDLFR